MTANDPQAEPIPLYETLNARQIAKTLLLRESDKEYVLEELLLWPPDLFAFTSLIFSITGAYHMVVSPPHDDGFHLAKWPPTENWTSTVRRIGLKWRSKLAGYLTKQGSKTKATRGCFVADELRKCKSSKLSLRSRKKLIYERVGRLDGPHRWVQGAWVPSEVGVYFKSLCSRMHPKDKVEDLFDDWEGLKLLMMLHAIADEACVGWGIREIPLRKTNDGFATDTSLLGKVDESGAAAFAAEQLKHFGTMATFNPLRGRVLPKRHTPTVGITLRSMSSNLAFHRSSVDVKWRVAENKNLLTERLTRPENKIFSVLLLPWPERVSASDFHAIPKTKRLRMSEEFGLFKYSPDRPADTLFESELRSVLASAQNETDEIDIVVLPECALDENQIPLFEKVIGDEQFNVSAYVAGVRGLGQGKNDDVFTDNMVYFKMGDTEQKGKQRTVYKPLESEMNEVRIQYKHHRWKMDRFQIQNYNLGNALSPHKHWWESIKIRRRKVTFINVGNELTLCPLICEDLSRQDPIADLIRTVGPSLVITILMDGPQKRERWSARYASVLSEDPGCAVITLTSAGMVDRWTPPTGNTSRAVALWNDGQGSEREITLEKNAIGVLLSLSVSPGREVSADGREENYPTNQIILGGIRQVFK